MESSICKDDPTAYIRKIPTFSSYVKNKERFNIFVFPSHPHNQSASILGYLFGYQWKSLVNTFLQVLNSA